MAPRPRLPRALCRDGSTAGPTAGAARLVVVVLAAAAVLAPTAALAQRGTSGPVPQPPVTNTAAPTATVVVDKSVVDHGGAHLFGVFGTPRTNVTVYAVTLPGSTPMAIRQANLAADGSYVWALRPGGTTTYFAVADAVPTEPVTVHVRRTATIGVRQAGGVHTFTGQVSRAEAGLDVVLARFGSETRRVTTVGSTRTDAAGRYTVRTRLPMGFAAYYALTAPTTDLLPGRSRLYGLIVEPAQSSGSITIDAQLVEDVLFFSGAVDGQPREVPVTLGRLVDGRLVGVRGGLTDSTGGYSLGVSPTPGASAFQVVTATARSPVCRVVVPAAPRELRCS